MLVLLVVLLLGQVVISRWSPKRSARFAKLSNVERRNVEEDSEEEPQEFFDTIVIGSGISGLSTAAALMTYKYPFMQHGHKVLVLEKGSRPGGAFKTIPYFHHYVDPETGEQVGKLVPIPIGYHYTPCVPGLTMGIHDLVQGVDPTNPLTSPIYDYVVAESPGTRFFKTNNEILMNFRQFFDPVLGVEGSAPHALGLLAEDLIGVAIQRGLYDHIGPISQWFEDMGAWLAGARPDLDSVYMYDYLNDLLGTDPEVDIFKFLMTDRSIDVGPNKDDGILFSTNTVMYTIYAEGPMCNMKGGPDALFQNLTMTIGALGGEIRTGMEVTKIRFDEGNSAIGVQVKSPPTQEDDNGRTFLIRTNNIVLATGGANTGFKLLPNRLLRDAGLENFEENALYGGSVVVVDLVFDALGDELQLPIKTDIIVPEPVKAPQDYHASPRPAADGDEELMSYIQSYTTQFQPEVVGDAPFSTVALLAVVPFGWFAEWEDTFYTNRPPDYYDFVENYLVRKMKQRFYGMFPQAEEHEVHAHWSTPLEIRDHGGMPYGSYCGTSQESKLRNSLNKGTKLDGFANVWATGNFWDCGVSLGAFSGLGTAFEILGVPFPQWADVF